MLPWIIAGAVLSLLLVLLILILICLCMVKAVRKMSELIKLIKALIGEAEAQKPTQALEVVKLEEQETQRLPAV
jgi:uncharacterized membrane protein